MWGLRKREDSYTIIFQDDACKINLWVVSEGMIFVKRSCPTVPSFLSKRRVLPASSLLANSKRKASCIIYQIHVWPDSVSLLNHEIVEVIESSASSELPLEFVATRERLCFLWRWLWVFYLAPFPSSPTQLTCCILGLLKTARELRKERKRGGYLLTQTLF